MGEAVRRGRGSAVLAWVRKYRFELVLVAPLVVYMVVLTIAPILDTIRISFTDQSDLAFPSLASYTFIFGNEVFRQAVVNTLIVALLSLTLELTIGMAVALALHVPFRGRGFFRTVMLVPLGVPTIVAGAVMLLLFSRSGYLNALFASFYDLLPGDAQFQAINWTSGGFLTLLTIAIADMWKVLPVVTLIFLAGLQSIPEEVYEAADVDGATKWQRFWRVTLPLLVPYITMALILRAIDAFRIFELALVIGGIRVAPVLGTFIGSRYLPPTSDPFTAAAASMVLFVIIMVFIVLYLR
ncbi:MAG TPA: sugar ABC transporter permease, partial [Actinomycetota bacterium]|nr:sugar ABC transporter permease [Actinomycetota bacterium]